MLGLGNSLSQVGLVDSAAAAAFTDDYSVALDGTGDYIDLGSPFQSTFRGSFSASWWVNIDDSTPGTHQMMFGATSDSDNSMYVALLSSGKWYFFTEMNGVVGQVVQVVSGLSGNSATGWIHVAVTHKNNGGSNKPTKVMYINGSAISIQTGGTLDGDDQDAFVATQNIYIGGYNSAGSVSNPVTGKMNDVGIWSTDLDADAVAAIYNSGSPTDLTVNSGNYDNSGNLVGYWKFEENTGTTATDSAGSNDGTFAGDPQWDSSTP